MHLRKLSAFVVLFGFSGIVPALADSSCRLAPDASPPTRRVTTIEFRNFGTSPLRVDWVDFDGNLKNYGEVRAGGTFTQSTFVSHVWQLTAMTGECKKRVVARRSADKVQVN